MMVYQMKTILIGALFLSVTNNVMGAKILGIFPMPSRSHRNLYNPLMMELVKRGHDVTVISPFEEKNPPQNGSYRDILLPGLSEKLQELRKSLHADGTFEKLSIIKSKHAAELLTQITEMTLANGDVQKLINLKEKFDLVIITNLVNRAHMALATHFGAPLVIFSTVGSYVWTNLLVGNPAPPSYVPDIFLGTSGELTFYERLENSLIFVFHHLYFNLFVNPRHNKLIKKYIPNGPELDDILGNVSLVLLNSHPSINQPVPFVPNMIEIGGFHIKPPKKLPEDLQKYLDEAPDGVIYFSMGSNLKSSELPPELRQIFLNTFAKLKQKILWKWEDETLPGKPPNVKISKWLPQQDILAHPNIKLFITHGGLLSVTETVYHGVPILALPVFGDQHSNAKIAVDKGFGLSLSLNGLTEEKFTQNIQELIQNVRYKNNAKTKSKFFNDRLVSPMETAMYWLEYVIRHKGAPHLKVGAVDLPWYKYFLVDVIGFLFFTTLTFCVVLYKIIKRVCRCKNKESKLKRS